MNAKTAVLALAFLLIISYAGALRCGEGDRGGRLLQFTFECYDLGSLTIDCSYGTDRPQCFKITSCDAQGCGTDLDGGYIESCEAGCSEGMTFLEVICEPLPLTLPAMNLPLGSYTGYADRNFVIEGFAADNDLVKDIYFEDVEGCDLNQQKEGLGTTNASVKATFECSQVFSEREITLVAKDPCGAVSTDTAFLSVEKPCPNDCIPRLYPQCRAGELVECEVDNNCTTLKKTLCEYGCRNFECCVPLPCNELGLECGLAFNNCDENVSCGDCLEGAYCSGNKCIATAADAGQPLQPGGLSLPGFDPVLIAAVVIAVVAGIVVFRRLRG